MTESFGVRFTRSWVAFYTRRLSEPVRERRRAEMASDLWEQVNDAPSGRASAQVLDRCLRGIHADLWWRYRTLLEQREAHRISSHTHTMSERLEASMNTIKSGWWRLVACLISSAIAVTAAVNLLLWTGDKGGPAGLLLVSTLGAATVFLGLSVRGHSQSWGSMLIAIGLVPSVLLITVPWFPFLFAASLFALPAAVAAIVDAAVATYEKPPERLTS